MKKLLTLALAAIMCAGSAKALDYVPEPGFTFQGFFGMNISNFRYTDSSVDCLTDPKAGFNIGVRGEYMLPSCYGVFVNLGVGYTMNGAKLNDVIVGDESRDVTVKYRTTSRYPCTWVIATMCSRIWACMPTSVHTLPSA